MTENQQLREHLIKLMQGGQAFARMKDIIEDLKADEAGKKVAALPYTIWQLLEHLRFTLHDIVDFSRNPDYRHPRWPEDYWVHEDAPANQKALDDSLKTIETDMEAMIQLVKDPANDLYEPFAHGDGQTLLREAMLIAEHNAYHLGQIVVLRRLLGRWE